MPRPNTENTASAVLQRLAHQWKNQADAFSKWAEKEPHRGRAYQYRSKAEELRARASDAFKKARLWQDW